MTYEEGSKQGIEGLLINADKYLGNLTPLTDPCSGGH